MKTNASSLASVLALLALSASRAAAQLPVPVGAGSYASFPPAGEGTGVADMLTRTIYVTDPNRPIPTNDWWTDLVVSQYAGTMWAYPLAVSANSTGLNVYYPTAFNAGGTAMGTDSPLQIRGEVLPAPAPTDVLIADFESAAYPAGWTTTGTAFGSGPAAGTLPGQSAVSGYLGARLVNSFLPGDGAQGTLTSSVFVVSQDFLHFLIAGGNTVGATEVQLIVNGVVQRTASGTNSEALHWTTWDVSSLRGQNARIKIVDTATGGWGHICADQFFLSADATNPAAKFDTNFAPADARAKEWSDWLVQFRMAQDANRFIDVTMGHGLPFVWVECNNVKPKVKTAAGARYFNAGGNIATFPITADRVGIEYAGRRYGVYAPDGTQFALSGDTLTATFSGTAKYLVVGALKTDADLATLGAYAFAIPRDTRMDWSFDPELARVRTTWNVTAQALKGANTDVLQGWVPHHYRTNPHDLAFTGHEYLTPRGKLKLASGHTFTIDFPFRGILPTLPAPRPSGLANDYDATRMNLYSQLYATRTGYGAETYFGGKDLTQFGQYLNFAHELGRTSDFNKLKQSLRTALTDWLTYTPGETEHYFARYPNWRALVGFNESFYSFQFTDHHFHYGYFTHAAALLGMHDPQFLTDYGPMAKLVAKEYANWDRTDTTQPFLRTFNVWSGHSYAGGFSSPGGNNQESSSEAMQSWSGLFLLGSVMGDADMTAAGAMGYAMESLACEEYWDNYYGWRDGLAAGNFDAAYNTTSTMAGILFDSGQAYATYFSGDPGWIYGIHWLPISPAMNYLVRDPVFAQHQFDEMMSRRAVSIAPEPNTISQMGTALGQVILGYEQMFNPGAVAAEMDALWAASDPVATSNDTPGITYYFTHANRDLGRIAWEFTTSLPTSQSYFHAGRNETTHVLYNPAATFRLANVYNNHVLAGQVLVPPRSLVRTSALLQAGATFAALASTPENGATNVDRALTQIAFACSKNVDSATLAVATISGPGATGLSYASGHGTRLIVFNITGVLAADATYQVTLPASIATTEGGVTLGAPFVFSFQTAPLIPPDTGSGSHLTAHLRLDETTGTLAADSSPLAHHGMYRNAPTLAQSGRVATAVAFDGVDDFVELPRTYELGILGDFTISAWVNPEAVNGDRTIVGTDGYAPQQGLHLLVRNGKPHFGFYGDDTTGVTTIPTGAWTHIVFRLHQGEQAIFVNGVLDTASLGHSTFTGLQPVLIGRWGGNSGTPKLFQGRIDDVQIYRRALTDAEITALYANPGSENAAGVQNFPPVVQAGTDQVLDFPANAVLNGLASDDGLPVVPGAFTVLWTKVSGPGVVNFANANAPATTASFSAPGPYVLRLTATDGDLTHSDDITIALLTGDLIAHYTLNETTGTICNDTSGNALHGTFIAAPLLAQTGAATGTATSVNFNGSTQVIELGTPGLLNGLVNNFTVSAWIRPTSTSGSKIIFGSNWQSGNGWSLRLSGGNLALERLGPTQLYNSAVSIPINVWTHVAASYGTDNSVTFFKNGSVVATIAGTAPAAASTRPWYIAGNGSGENTTGRLDDIQVYRRALTANEVAFLFANPGQVFTNANSTYSLWSAAAFSGMPGADPSFTADPDRDGISNGLEYTFLTSPGAPTAPAFTASRDGTGNILLSFPLNRAATDLVLEIQTKSDLSTATWQTVAAQVVSQIANGPVDQITVRPLDLPASPTHFFRLGVRLAP